MNIIITGATGCLGQNLINKLQTYNEYNITALGRNTVIGKKLENNQTHFIEADIGERSKIFQLMQGKDIVIHCAALAKPWGRYPDFYRANVIGTQNVADAALAAKVARFIHVSTPSIYFNGREQFNINEGAALPSYQVNYYAKTKKMGEDIIDKAFQAGLPSVTIRPRALFGPHDTAIFPRLIRVAKKGWFPLIASGRAVVDVTYVGNVVDALILCMHQPASILGNKYNITNGEPMMVGTLLTNLFDALHMPVRFYSLPYKAALLMASVFETAHQVLPFSDREPLLTRYSAALLGMSQTLDINAAQIDLDYIPRITINDGLQKFALWWQTQENHAR